MQHGNMVTGIRQTPIYGQWHIAICHFLFVQGCWWVLSPTRKETKYSDRRFWSSYILFI